MKSRPKDQAESTAQIDLDLFGESSARQKLARLADRSFTWNKSGVCLNPLCLHIPLVKPFFADILIAGPSVWSWGYDIGRRGWKYGCFGASALPSRKAQSAPNPDAAATAALEHVVEIFRNRKTPKRVMEQIKNWRAKHGL